MGVYSLDYGNYRKRLIGYSIEKIRNYSFLKIMSRDLEKKRIRSFK